MILAWSDVWTPQGVAAVLTALGGVITAATLLIKALRPAPAPPAVPEPSHPEPPAPHGTPPAAA